MTPSGPDIRYLFEPRSIAVVGASHHPEKIGSKILQNIINAGYRGAIYPVNPKGGEILGRPVARALEEIPGELDVVCTCVPGAFVRESVEAAARKGVKFNLVISSGFSEVGNVEEEKRIIAIARAAGMRILGPNIFGMYMAASSLDMTFGPGGILPGNVAIITQSGALGLAMIGKTAVENVGISAMISVGNKADLDEADLLEYLLTDERTHSILMYIEGVKQGERLMTALKDAARKKPVVVIKSGRSKRGAIAAASHTGSLAGSDAIFDAMMRQCGALRAESVKEAFDLCKFLSDTPLPRGDNAVIITNGGGIGVLATDACEKYGVPLYDDTASLKETFGSVTPDFGSTKNPIDLTGQATSRHYAGALDAALRSDRIDAVLSLYCETAVFDVENLAPMIEENFKRYREAGKPIVFSVFGGATSEASVTSLGKRKIPIMGDVYDTVACLGGLYSYRRRRDAVSEKIDELPIDEATIDDILRGARADGRSFLLAQEGAALMRATGIRPPQSHVARSLDEAVRHAEAIGYPVVMKVVSRDILHKSDAGGVALDLDNREEVIDAYQAILRNCRARVPNARIDGIEVAEMVRRGVELIVGARRDPSFGPVVMFGHGGIYVEVMKDVSFRAAAMDRAEAVEMMKEIRAYPLLLGVRGEERKDIDTVVDAILRLATVIRRCPGISDIEVNPLVVYDEGEGAVAVDARVLLAKIEGGRSDA
jgi:acetyltransferase